MLSSVVFYFVNIYIDRGKSLLLFYNQTLDFIVPRVVLFLYVCTFVLCTFSMSIFLMICIYASITYDCNQTYERLHLDVM